MNDRTITDADVEAIAQRTAALLRPTQISITSPNDTLTRANIRLMLKCESDAAMYRRLAELGVKPYAHGKYRRGDLDNAIARAALRAQKHGRVAA